MSEQHWPIGTPARGTFAQEGSTVSASQSSRPPRQAPVKGWVALPGLQVWPRPHSGDRGPVRTRAVSSRAGPGSAADSLFPLGFCSETRGAAGDIPGWKAVCCRRCWAGVRRCCSCCRHVGTVHLGGCRTES
ncbi:uncharacterized protein LOC109455568 [Rhinolophus sinicus]|uniref:uncharacterized protein LOC109455568 n=1 Tax=Rhinolophus sinicus TaxID=89399 RepID=UPI003D78C1CE